VSVDLIFVVVCVLVTSANFKNVKVVLVHEPASLPCISSPNTTVRWYYQQYCEDFEHGLYSCSSPAAITIKNQHGEHSLLLSSVTKNMTGLYSCKNRETQAIIYSVLLNILCK